MEMTPQTPRPEVAPDNPAAPLEQASEQTVGQQQAVTRRSLLNRLSFGLFGKNAGSGTATEAGHSERRVSRRAFLGTAATVAGGVVLAGTVGCGDAGFNFRESGREEPKTDEEKKKVKDIGMPDAYRDNPEAWEALEPAQRDKIRQGTGHMQKEGIADNQGRVAIKKNEEKKKEEPGILMTVATWTDWIVRGGVPLITEVVAAVVHHLKRNKTLERQMKYTPSEENTTHNNLKDKTYQDIAANRSINPDENEAVQGDLRATIIALEKELGEADSAEKKQRAIAHAAAVIYTIISSLGLGIFVGTKGVVLGTIVSGIGAGAAVAARKYGINPFFSTTEGDKKEIDRLKGYLDMLEKTLPGAEKRTARTSKTTDEAEATRKKEEADRKQREDEEFKLKLEIRKAKKLQELKLAEAAALAEIARKNQAPRIILPGENNPGKNP